MSKAYLSLLKSLPTTKGSTKESESGTANSLAEKYKHLIQETTAEHLKDYGSVVSDEEEEDLDEDLEEGMEGEEGDDDMNNAMLYEGEEGDNMMMYEGDDNAMLYEGEEGDNMMMYEGDGEGEGDLASQYKLDQEDGMMLHDDEDEDDIDDDDFNRETIDVISDSELSEDEQEQNSEDDNEEEETTMMKTKNQKRKIVDSSKPTATKDSSKNSTDSKTSKKNRTNTSTPYQSHFLSDLDSQTLQRLHMYSHFLPVRSGHAGQLVKSNPPKQIRTVTPIDLISNLGTSKDKYNRNNPIPEDVEITPTLLSDLQAYASRYTCSSDRELLKLPAYPEVPDTLNFDTLGIRPRLANYWASKSTFAPEVYPFLRDYLINIPEESQTLIETQKLKKLMNLKKTPNYSTYGTNTQKVLATCISNYVDVLYTSTTPSMAMPDWTELQDLYLSHCINHIYTTRDYIISHNEALARKAAKEREEALLSKAQHLSEQEQRALLLEREKVLLGQQSTSKDKSIDASLSLIRKTLKQSSGKYIKKQKLTKRQQLDEEFSKKVTETTNLVSSLAQVVDPNDKYRDQGFTRPKVLIMVPTRSVAYTVILRLLDLLPEKQRSKVLNLTKLHEEFGDLDEEHIPKAHRSLDYRLRFLGNDDDCFKLGISFSNTTVKLFSSLLQSDIIIGSPLGIKLLTGNEGDEMKDRKTDFLSSIEICVLDQSDAFTMQNLTHVHDVLTSMNTLPKQSTNIDFSRVKNWYLDGHAKFYRQTLIFTTFLSSQLNNIFTKYCENKAGKVRFRPEEYTSLLPFVRPKVKHIFMRLDEITDPVTAADKRFELFEKELWPKIKDAYKEKQTIFFVPNYFDYVRIRNFLKSKYVKYGILSEYTDPRMVGSVRTNFFKGKYQFVLVSERFHYFNRIALRAAKHVVWYNVPEYPHYYIDMLNYIDGAGKAAECVKPSSSFVLYSKLDTNALERIVGTEQCVEMLTSKQNVHMVTPK